MEDDPWDSKYLYYANEHPSFNNVMKIDTSDMTLKAYIPVWGLNPHSVDRACYTDKMYVRTQSSYSFGVIDARTEKFIKKVDLPFKPRTCGDQNYKYNLQLVGGTSDPGVALIDVDTDEVIYTAWSKADGRKPLGNQGSSAAGHSVWFDDLHFGYIDRLASEIWIFRLTDGDDNRVTHIQTLDSPTAMHSIQDDKIDVELTTTTIYGSVEGIETVYIYDSEGTPVGIETPGQLPGVVKYTFDPTRDSDKVLQQEGEVFRLPGSNDKDTVHHYSIHPNGNELWIPTYWTRKVHRISIPNMASLGQIDCGYGGGHVNFSVEQNCAVITNHFDTYVTKIDLTTFEPTNINSNRQYELVGAGKLIQTHSNWIIEDGRYFIIGNPVAGDFVKIDLLYNKVKYKLFVGGSPEQSIS